MPGAVFKRSLHDQELPPLAGKRLKKGVGRSKSLPNAASFETAAPVQICLDDMNTGVAEVQVLLPPLLLKPRPAREQGAVAAAAAPATTGCSPRVSPTRFCSLPTSLDSPRRAAPAVSLLPPIRTAPPATERMEIPVGKAAPPQAATATAAASGDAMEVSFGNWAGAICSPSAQGSFDAWHAHGRSRAGGDLDMDGLADDMHDTATSNSSDGARTDDSDGDCHELWGFDEVTFGASAPSSEVSAPIALMHSGDSSNLQLKAQGVSFWAASGPS